MKDNTILGRRIKNARVMRNLSMDALCEKISIPISKMSISKYETNKAVPSSEILIALSQALELPLDYFFRPFSFSVENIKFRKKSHLGKKKLEGIKEEIADYIERYIEIEEICAVENVSFNKKIVENKDAVIKYANELRNTWELGQGGIVNVIELLEEQGIKIVEIDADLHFDGMSTIVNSTHPVLVLNKNLCSERKRFTALHELGHLLLSLPNSLDPKEEEIFCNCFASEMLIPSSVFKKLLGESRHNISYFELLSIQKQFGISIDAQMYKAKNLGIISENRHISYCKKKNFSSDFKEKVESSYYPPEESLRFKKLVHRAISKEIISLSKAASLLNVNLANIRQEAALV